MIDFLDDKRGDLSEYSLHINRKLKPQFVEAKRYARLVYSFPALFSSIFRHSPYVIESIYNLLRGEMNF